MPCRRPNCSESLAVLRALGIWVALFGVALLGCTRKFEPDGATAAGSTANEFPTADSTASNAHTTLGTTSTMGQETEWTTKATSLGTDGASSTSNGTTTRSNPTEGNGSTSGESPPSRQPRTGMWAHCLQDQFDNCVRSATTCIYVTDPDDGYCTSTGCSDPVADCDPPPAGASAIPFCMAAGGDSFCALDCSSATCSPNMECRLVTFDQTQEFAVCM